MQINLCNPLVMLQISTALLETKRGYDKLQDNSEKSKIFLNTCIILKELEQFNFSYSGKMLWPICRCEILCVRSPCITGAMHWGHPSHRANTDLLWKFGVSTCSICKVKFHLSLSCCSEAACIYRLFVDILSRHDLFWCLAPVSSPQASSENRS